MLTGCGSKQLIETNYGHAELLNSELSDKRIIDEDYLLSIDNKSVLLKLKKTYSQTQLDHYQKIKIETYKVESSATGGEIAYASFMIPIGFAYDVILCFGLFMGEFMPLTTHAIEPLLNNPTSIDYKRTPLSGQVVSKTKTLSSETIEPVSSAPVNLDLNNILNKIAKTNQAGMVEFDPYQMLVKSNIHPKNLVRDEGLKITAKTMGMSQSINLRNSQIPEKYFKEKYIAYRSEMLTRESRLENCESIASSNREIFECFYQEF